MAEDKKIDETLNEGVKTEEPNVEEVKEPSKKEVKNKLREENKKLLEEIAKLQNDLLRNRADLENFKKHMNEERIQDRKYASTNLVTDIITPLEYLTKACEYQTDNQEMKNFLIGFQMISKQLMSVLESDGLKVIECNVGDDFNPEVHHAMETVKVEGMDAHKIAEVLARGFKYKDRIIKPAMVKVSE